MINPNNYECVENSPVGDSYFSDTKPHIPLTHIFCGQIADNGKAQGYHALSNNIPPVCAKNDMNLEGTFGNKIYSWNFNSRHFYSI